MKVVATNPKRPQCQGKTRQMADGRDWGRRWPGRSGTTRLGDSSLLLPKSLAWCPKNGSVETDPLISELEERIQGAKASPPEKKAN